MSEGNVESDLYVIFKKLSGLVTSRSEVAHTILRVEFDSKTISESEKIRIEESMADFHFQVDLHQLDLNYLCKRPLIVTVLECLPKEKKQKDEKIVPLCKMSLDISTIFKDQVDSAYSQPMYTVPGSLPIQKQTTIDYFLSPGRIFEDGSKYAPILSRMKIGSMFALPEMLQSSLAHSSFIAASPLFDKSQSESSCVTVFMGAQATSDQTEIFDQRVKWNEPEPSLTGEVTYIVGSSLSKLLDSSEESGDLRKKSELAWRTEMLGKSHLEWNQESRQLLKNATDCKLLQSKIASHRFWPVEVFRMTSGPTGKGKKPEDNWPYHGVAYVDLSPLIYPGVRKVCGFYKLQAFTSSKYMEQCGREQSTYLQALKIVTEMTAASSNKPKKEDKAKDTKKTSREELADPDAPEAERVSENPSGELYERSGTFVWLEVELSRALVASKSREQVVAELADLVPPRPRFPRRPDNERKVVNEFHAEVANVARLLLQEIRQAKEGTSQESREKLFYELNSSGKYFAFKEQLKFSVVKIVREKYLKKTKFEDEEEFQAFLSKLYVFLVDEMHSSLQRELSVGQPTEPIRSAQQLDSNRLLLFADEEQADGNAARAASYHLERISRCEADAVGWLDYGKFCLRSGHVTKAEECFRSAVAREHDNLHGVLLVGVTCLLLEKSKEAEQILRAACQLSPDNPLAWTVLGLVYASFGDDVSSERHLEEADKLMSRDCRRKLQAASLTNSEKFPENQQYGHWEERSPRDGHREEASPRDGHQEEASPRDGHREGASPHDGHLEEASPRDGHREERSPHDDHREKSSPRDGQREEASPREPKARKREGQLEPETGSREKNIRQAKSAAIEDEANGKQMDCDSDINHPSGLESENLHDHSNCSIFLEAAKFLLDGGAVSLAERSLALQLLESEGRSGVAYLLVLAELQASKGDSERAMSSLEAALKIDSQNADVWNLLGSVQREMDEQLDAMRSWERVLVMEQQPANVHRLHRRLGQLYLDVEERATTDEQRAGRDPQQLLKQAKEQFLLSCQKLPSPKSWQGVGIACFRLNELAAAEEALTEANLLDNDDPRTWAYLSLVCLDSGRSCEAEQAFKYATRLGLDDPILQSNLRDKQIAMGFGDAGL